jgi:hypothetical protein
MRTAADRSHQAISKGEGCASSPGAPTQSPPKHGPMPVPEAYPPHFYGIFCFSTFIGLSRKRDDDFSFYGYRTPANSRQKPQLNPKAGDSGSKSSNSSPKSKKIEPMSKSTTMISTKMKGINTKSTQAASKNFRTSREWTRKTKGQELTKLRLLLALVGFVFSFVGRSEIFPSHPVLEFRRINGGTTPRPGP